MRPTITRKQIILSTLIGLALAAVILFDSGPLPLSDSLPVAIIFGLGVWVAAFVFLKERTKPV